MPDWLLVRLGPNQKVAHRGAVARLAIGVHLQCNARIVGHALDIGARPNVAGTRHIQQKNVLAAHRNGLSNIIMPAIKQANETYTHCHFIPEYPKLPRES